MTGEDALAAVLGALAEIAPDVDVATLERDEDVRAAADLDSMDFLALVESLAEQTGVAVPEKDYGQVRTIEGMAAYLVEHAS